MAEKNPNDPLPPQDSGLRNNTGESVSEEPMELFDFIDETELQAAPPADGEEPLELLDFYEDVSPAEAGATPPMAEPVAEAPLAEEVDLLDFFEEIPEAPISEKTDPAMPAARAGADHTWAELAMDEASDAPPAPAAEHAEKTDFIDFDADIFASDRTEVDMPASAVNLFHPNVEPTLKSDDDDDSDANVSIGVAPPNETDEPLTAARLYASNGDSDVQPVPMAEPVEFGAGAEEIDFDILRSNESSSGLYSQSHSPADASGVQLGETPSAVDSASSIFGDDLSVIPTSPGSGWFDDPRSARYALPTQFTPPSSKTSIGEPDAPRSGGSIADLFGMLARGPATPSVSVSSGWVKEDKTGTVSESEVLKAFDELAKSPSTTAPVQLPPSPASDALAEPAPKSGESGPDFNKVDLDGEGSNLFPQPENTEHDMFAPNGPSGVDILEAAGLMDTGGSQSSIFSQGPRPGSASDATQAVTYDEAIDFDDRHDALFGGSGIHGSSIFEKGKPQPGIWEADLSATQTDQPALDIPDMSEQDVASHDAIEAGLDWGEPTEAYTPVKSGVEWDLPEGADADQVSMYMPKPDSVSDIEELFHPAGPVSPVKPEQDILASDSSSHFVGVVGSTSAADSGIIHGPASGAYSSGPVSGVIRAAQIAEDDEPVALATPKKAKKKKDEVPAKRKGSLGGWIGGGVAGLLLGAGGVGGAYMAGLLPAVDGSKPNVPPVAKADPRMAEELKTAVAKLAETEKKSAEEAEVMSTKLRTSGEEFNKVKDELDDAKAAEVKAQTALKTAMAAKTKVEDELKSAKTDAEKAKDDAKLAKADAEKAAKDLVDAKKTLTEAEALALDTEKKRKAADDALAGVVKELKAAKLIPDDDEPAVALAKLPDVFKNAAIAMTSADAKKAAESLAMASKQIDTLKQAMAKVEESLTTAKAETKEVMTAAEKAKADAAKMLADAKKETDDKVAAAVAKAAADAKKQIDDANATALAAEAQRKKDSAAHEAQLKVLADTHAKQLLEARAGGGIELTTAEARALDKSFASYGRGVNSYHSRKFAEAETALKEATADFQSDARYWYFLGLAQFQQGKNADAETSFKKGAELERKNLPGRAVINEDLQRIQGALRLELAKFRP